MVQILLISSVIEVERRLVYQEERRVNRRLTPYMNYLAAPNIQKNETCQEENKAPADFIQALTSNL